MTPRNTVRRLLLTIALSAFFVLLPNSHCQTDLSGISAKQADDLIIKLNGRWVLEAIDSRPVREDCIGKVFLKFSPDRTVVETTCIYGQISERKLKWAIRAKDEYEKVLDLDGVEKVLLFKDTGKNSKHEYHMRLRQNDVTNPKGGMNLEHDYKLVESTQ